MTILSKATGVQKPSKPLRISFTNICGLCTNSFDLQTSFHQTYPDIFAISESLLNSDVADDDFQFPGYQPLTRERDNVIMV